MEAIKNFEWALDSGGYRLARVPTIDSNDAFWCDDTTGWDDTSPPKKPSKLTFGTSVIRGESRQAKPGLYVAGFRYNHHRSSSERENHSYVIKPFESDELISLNILNYKNTPSEWLRFINKYGMLGSTDNAHWHLSGKDHCTFSYEVEHEGEWHHIRNVLRTIYNYYPAIKNRDNEHLSNYIFWDEQKIPREIGFKIGKTKISPAIAMPNYNELDYSLMKFPDLFHPAAVSMKNYINRYMEKSISLKIDYDTENFNFDISMKYASFGAAIIAEAVEFISGHFEAKACVVCGSWFRLGAAQRRRDRQFCSAACKMRDYRARKAKRASHD